MSLCLYKLNKLNINDIEFKLYQPRDKKKYTIKCFNKKGQNILIETIPLYTPYGINTKTLIHNTVQLTVSLSSKLIDANTEQFYKNMGEFEQHIVNNEDKFISNNYASQSMSMISCIDENDKINFYTQDIKNNTFLAYDLNNNEINYDNIKSKSFVQCILWLSGIWVNNDVYGLNWKLIQCKLYPDLFSIDKCLFLDEDYDVKEIFYNLKDRKNSNQSKLINNQDYNSNENSNDNTKSVSDDDLQELKKMLKIGIPKEAVAIECKKKNIDPKILGIEIEDNPIIKPKQKAKSKPLPLNNKNTKTVAKIKPPSADELKAQIALLRKTNKSD